LTTSSFPPTSVSASESASPRFIDLSLRSGLAAGHQHRELTASLLAPAASIAPKYFYNALGSKLFEAITLLDEYYPTRTEAAIFEHHSTHIAHAVASAGIHNACLIDLGAGNCAKAAALIPHLKPKQYVPVDISVDFLRDAASQVQASFPTLDIVGVGMDFSSALSLPDVVQTHDRVFFYPGSSLGNFSPAEALHFLQQISDRAQGSASGLLLGIDLVKDAAVLEAAYDDAAGVTAAFNKNVLLNINEQLGADFDLRQWQHVALFNSKESRIEMHLQATTDNTVHWTGHQRHFKAGERIHTENSYKYTLDSMSALLKQAGFGHVQHWADTQGWFGVFWASK
jgi:dimethylhistidine N-methyltransferase